MVSEIGLLRTGLEHSDTEGQSAGDHGITESSGGKLFPQVFVLF